MVSSRTHFLERVFKYELLARTEPTRVDSILSGPRANLVAVVPDIADVLLERMQISPPVTRGVVLGTDLGVATILDNLLRTDGSQAKATEIVSSHIGSLFKSRARVLRGVTKPLIQTYRRDTKLLDVRLLDIVGARTNERRMDELVTQLEASGCSLGDNPKTFKMAAHLGFVVTTIALDQLIPDEHILPPIQ